MTNHCTYTQALALKELGFDMPVRDYYDVTGGIIKTDQLKNWHHKGLNWIRPTSAPTRSEVLQWAREKKGIDGWVEALYYSFKQKEYRGCYQSNTSDLDSHDSYPTHAEAESALVDMIIEILKTDKPEGK